MIVFNIVGFPWPFTQRRLANLALAFGRIELPLSLLHWLLCRFVYIFEISLVDDDDGVHFELF
jgi:hypothetical protein